ncbi:MAG: Wzy polymerase domain-containing protein [Hafnia sp.]|uniref:O-antigen ligase family protein n=1 Tax=Hafnia sp. TaxID=1873498 RepID=UPI002FC77407
MSDFQPVACLRSGYPRAFYLAPGMVLALLLIVLLPVPWTSLPGGGLNKALNLISWIWVCSCGLCLIPMLWRRRLCGHRVILILLVGGGLMGLPLLWTPEPFRVDAVVRLAGVIATLIFFSLLLQFPVRGGQRRVIYRVLVLAGVIQVMLACWQISAPSSAEIWLWYDMNAADGRPLGSLNQVNLLSSFLATALACGVWLMLSAPRCLGRKRWGSLFNVAAIVLLSAGIVMTQSRAIQFGAVLTMGVLVGLQLDSHSLRKVLVCLFGGLLLGLLALPVLQTTPLTPDVTAGDTRPDDVQARLEWNRQHSNNERLTLFNGALLLSREHPLFGEGLGTFEERFPLVLHNNGVINPFPLTVVHPHNELLYVWFEGGLVAMAGFLLFLVIWFKPFQRFFTGLLPSRIFPWCYASLKGRNVAARGALSIPVMTHIMSEFPLYQSVIHLILLVVLLWLALPVKMCTAVQSRATASISTNARLAMTIVIAALSLTGILFMSTGIYTSLELHEAESFGLMEPSALKEVVNPWAQPDRLMFDRAVSDLMAYNQTHDRKLLTDFQQKAELWLSRHNDANLTWSMLLIARAHNNTNSVNHWRERGCLSFYQDSRFRCSLLQPVSR